MLIEPIKIRLLHPPRDDLRAAVLESAIAVRERDIIVVSSKVVAISQGRTILQSSVKDKDELIMQEAEWYLPRSEVPGRFVIFTRKNGVVIPSAGIDESNAGEYYILWPERIEETAYELLDWFKKTFDIHDLGLIITDSHSVPFRRGIVGFGIGWAGFHPLYDYRGSADLFERELRVSQTNVVDSLAAAAVLAMGEGKEQTPLALMHDVPRVQFGEVQQSESLNLFVVSPEEDLYAPFYTRVPWEKGGSCFCG